MSGGRMVGGGGRRESSLAFADVAKASLKRVAPSQTGCRSQRATTEGRCEILDRPRRSIHHLQRKSCCQQSSNLS